MVNKKGGDTLRRPQPPSFDAIIADVVSASSDDPVFRESKVATSVTESDEQSRDVEACYRKVRELLKNLTAIHAGRNQLEKMNDQLISSKDDVAEMSTKLKTRLEMRRLSNSRPAVH